MSKLQKKIIVITIIVMAIALFSLVGLVLVKNQRELNDEMNFIKASYDDLSDNVTKYNKIRNKYNDMSKEIILDNYKTKQEEYLTLLNQYNDVIKEIDSNVSKIDSKCDRLYSNSDINTICDNYQKIYEKLINLYVGDITNYNESITMYNNYKKDNLGLFPLIHKDYIDYNNDSIYEGRYDSNEKK